MPIPAPIIGAMISAGASLASTGANAVTNAKNRRAQFEINKYNAEQNRLNLQTQMAYNSASTASQRQYDSPREQLARLTEAGVNAFTAQDMLGSDTGIGTNGISPSASNAQAYMSNFSLSDIVQSLNLLSSNLFSKDANDKQIQATKDNLTETLNNATDLEKMRINQAQLSQVMQMLHDVDMLEKQQTWQTEERKDSQTFQKDFQDAKYNLEQKLLKTTHENSLKILEKQNEFTKDENTKRREHESRSWMMQSHYRKKEYEHKREEDSKWVEDEEDLSIPPHLKRKSTHKKWFSD